MAIGDVYTLTYPEPSGGVNFTIGPVWIDWVSVEATIDAGPTAPYLFINEEAVLISSVDLDAGDPVDMESLITPVLAVGIGLGLDPVTLVSGITIQYRQAAEPEGSIIDSIMPLIIVMMMMGMIMPMLGGITNQK